MNVENLKNMFIGKSTFGITSNQNFTYIIGGVIYRNKTSSSCEKFDIIKNTWIRIKNLNFA